MQGKIVTAFIFLTMMTGAVSAAPVLDYTGAERLEEAQPFMRGREKKIGRNGCACPAWKIWEAA